EPGLLPLVNGGLETGDFTGWTLSGEALAEWVTADAQYVQSGMYAAELGPPYALGYLSQSLATTPGQVYLISFWLYNPGPGVGNEFQVNWAGTTVYDQINLGTVPYTNIQILVAASQSNSVLQFGFRNYTFAFGLDDVQVFQATTVAPGPPSFIFQPTNQTVTAGTTVQLDAGVRGIEPIYFQWLQGSSNIPGATNSTLFISPVTTADSGAYTLLASNAFGTTNSSNAILTVLQPP